MAALACTSFAPEPTTKGITATANFGFKDRLLFAAELANDNLWLFIVVNIEYYKYSHNAFAEYRNLPSTHRHYTSPRWLRFVFFLLEAALESTLDSSMSTWLRVRRLVRTKA